MRIYGPSPTPPAEGDRKFALVFHAKGPASSKLGFCFSANSLACPQAIGMLH